MQHIGLSEHIDLAQIALYAFWIFFAGLILYLLRENKREGYALVAPNHAGQLALVEPWQRTPTPKSFLMADGRTVLAPRAEPPEEFQAVRTSTFPGAPIWPTGEKLLARVGPGAWANRHDEPDLTFDDGLPKIVPLRSAPAFFLAWEDPDLHGFDVLGADRLSAGTVLDVWIDRSEVVVRYLEVALREGAGSVLLPMTMLRIDAKAQRILCNYVSSAQFALVPRTKHPEQVTLLEEDKIQAFYAGGGLFAAPGRAEPLL